MKKYPTSVLVIRSLSLVAILFSIGYNVVIAYGRTEVDLIKQRDKIYANIKNGWIGANCYNGKGEKIIAPSRWFGEKYFPVASVDESSVAGGVITLSCKEYDVLGSNPEAITDSIRL